MSERCESGEQREAARMAATIPKKRGASPRQLLGGRMVTEFNYRFADAKMPVFLSAYAPSSGAGGAKRDYHPTVRRRL